MPAKKSNEAKVTLWTNTMKAEFNGSISACALELFGYIMAGTTKTAAENREHILQLMQQRHEQLKDAGR